MEIFWKKQYEFPHILTVPIENVVYIVLLDFSQVTWTLKQVTFYNTWKKEEILKLSYLSLNM